MARTPAFTITAPIPTVAEVAADLGLTREQRAAVRSIVLDAFYGVRGRQVLVRRAKATRLGAQHASEPTTGTESRKSYGMTKRQRRPIARRVQGRAARKK